jgi:hypothetical protein
VRSSQMLLGSNIPNVGMNPLSAAAGMHIPPSSEYGGGGREERGGRGGGGGGLCVCGKSSSKARGMRECGRGACDQGSRGSSAKQGEQMQHRTVRASTAGQNATQCHASPAHLTSTRSSEKCPWASAGIDSARALAPIVSEHTDQVRRGACLRRLFAPNSRAMTEPASAQRPKTSRTRAARACAAGRAPTACPRAA